METERTAQPLLRAVRPTARHEQKVVKAREVTPVERRKGFCLVLRIFTMNRTIKPLDSVCEVSVRFLFT